MNTHVRFSCANGNALIGAPEIVCLPSGNWSSPFPVCESELNTITAPAFKMNWLNWRSLLNLSSISLFASLFFTTIPNTFALALLAAVSIIKGVYILTYSSHLFEIV